MSPPDNSRSAAIRAVIADFLGQRVEAKIADVEKDKKLDDDAKRQQKRTKLREQFVFNTWLEDAARRVGQIQAVTHSLKAIHPDAKGSSLFREPRSLTPLKELGSHALGLVFDVDVVGNAAALDIYKFLKLEVQGRSLMSLAIEGDADLGVALSPDADIAHAWMTAFAGLVRSCGQFSSHTQAKQIYWPVAGDPHDDAGFHLLAPLYPTSLIQRFYETLQDDRFGDGAKVARAARKAGEWHERPVREYPNLAIQKLGGSNQQNISQLNSERRGDNCLLASLPPVWQSPTIKPVLNVASLFDVFRWRREVRALAAHLRRYLESDPARNKETRERRNELVEALLDELMQFTAEVQTLAAGWSADPACDLPSHQIAWLDPEGTDAASTDMIDRIASDFAHWLNAQFRNPLPMGDPEYLHWRKQARELFKEAEREGAYEQ